MNKIIIFLTIFIIGLGYTSQDKGITKVLNPQFEGAELSIPKSINFQGYLYRDSNPMDTTMDMWFGIYNNSSGGNLLYERLKRAVEITTGWFTVILDNLPDSVFPVSGPTRYLEVEAPADSPPLTPRISLVSVGYSYHALKADTAEYAKAALVEPHNHLGESWLSTSINRGLFTKLDCNSSSEVNCLVDSALNSGTANAYGARMFAGGTGTGTKFGVSASASCPTGNSNAATGIFAMGYHEGTGIAQGGNFFATGTGTGDRYGINTNAVGSAKIYGVRSYAGPIATSTDSGFGVYGKISHYGSGRAYGGFFTTTGSGTGAQHGVVGYATANSNITGTCMGVSGSSTHEGTGSAYGGNFSASGDGTGHKVGVSGSGTGPTGSSNQGTGVLGLGFHYGQGDAYGGTFSSLAFGSGKSYGVRGNGSGSDDTVFGVYGSGSSSGSAHAYGVYGISSGGHGGYFRNQNNNYYALTAWNTTGSGATIRGLYVQGHGVATGGWQTFLNEDNTGFSLTSSDMELVASGSASLVDGKASITFESAFQNAISKDVVLKVIVTPTAYCNGVYVSDKSTSGFTVAELAEGKSNATFDWIAIGRVQGYEQRIKTKRIHAEQIKE